MIQQSRHHHLLNSRSEYNRCALPRMMCKLGDKNFKENEKEISRDMEKEEIQVAKIRDLIKERNKKRGQNSRAQKTQPPAKRMRPNDTEEGHHPEIQEMQEMENGEMQERQEAGQVKRKPENEINQEPKKKKPRVDTDIRDHFQNTTPTLDTGEERDAARLHLTYSKKKKRITERSHKETSTMEMKKR